MKKIIFLFLVILLLLLAFWDMHRSQVTQRHYQGPLKKIRIANIGEFSIFNKIAKEKGFFKEHGLDANVTEYDAGPSAIAALLSGKEDVAIAADYVGVINMFHNPNLRIISQASKHKVFYLIARKDKGVTSPSDLKHKRIGVTKKSAGEFYLGRFLTANNMSFTDVKEINLPPAQIVSQLKNGTIDAALIFDPHAYNLKQTLGNSVVSWSAQGEENTFAVMYSTAPFIKAHPELIKQYLQATIDSETFTKTSPEETQHLIASTLHYPNEYVRYMWDHFNFSVGLDQELVINLENQAQFAMDNGIVPNQPIPNYLNAIYFDGLASIKPEAVTIIH